MPSYYNNGPRAHTPSHLNSGIGVPSIFRSADCIQKAVAKEEHPLVNTSHGSRMRNLQFSHPYAFAALRQTELQKLEMEVALGQNTQPPTATQLLRPQ